MCLYDAQHRHGERLSAVIGKRLPEPLQPRTSLVYFHGCSSIDRQLVGTVVSTTSTYSGR